MHTCVSCFKNRPNHCDGLCNTCYKREHYSADKYVCTQCAVVCRQKPYNILMACSSCWRKEQQRQYSKQKRTALREYLAEWKTANKDKVKGYAKKHYQNNKHLYREKDSYRRALELQATPSWVNREELKKIYKNCPKGYHVDHIIPLKNERVCGLHVPANLQIIPAVENLRKNNKF